MDIIFNFGSVSITHGHEHVGLILIVNKLEKMKATHSALSFKIIAELSNLNSMI